jgi:hypothetical protein
MNASGRIRWRGTWRWRLVVLDGSNRSATRSGHSNFRGVILVFIGWKLGESKRWFGNSGEEGDLCHCWVLNPDRRSCRQPTAWTKPTNLQTCSSRQCVLTNRKVGVQLHVSRTPVGSVQKETFRTAAAPRDMLRSPLFQKSCRRYTGYYLHPGNFCLSWNWCLSSDRKINFILWDSQDAFRQWWEMTDRVKC